MTRVPASDGVASVAEHYEILLAEHYTWMAGDFAGKVAEQRALLARLGLPPAGGRALDLGCGSGFQSVALAELGFPVLAVDTSRTLLAELAGRTGTLPITTLEADIRGGLQAVEPGFAVAVCMGDTLTHLPSRDDVVRLFATVRRLLTAGGLFVIGLRDMIRPLEGTDRFIPVRSDADRIMTCFLEYEPETVIVHDLVHVREGSGWSLRKSAYRKLRLGTDWAQARLAEAGFAVERVQAVAGMALLAARA